MNDPNELGLLVGHYTDRAGGTGCTVVLCPRGAVGGVAVRGGAPCTRETDIFRPAAGVDPRRVHGVLLTGGSVFGLAASDGVVSFLSERGVGFHTEHACIPIIATAGLYDLGIVSATVRPDARSGCAACQAATGGPALEGSVGVGTGATVGKAAGMARSTKGGVGISTEMVGAGIIVQATVAVNALGEVVDPSTGQIVAGVRREDDSGFQPVGELLNFGSTSSLPANNTTLGVVAINTTLTKQEADEVAALAHDGFAQTIRPTHTRVDGDTIFVLATGAGAASGMSMFDLIALQYAATKAVADATLRAVRLATRLGGIPAVSDVR